MALLPAFRPMKSERDLMHLYSTIRRLTVVGTPGLRAEKELSFFTAITG